MSNIGIESLLGGGVGLSLVLGNAGLVLGEASEVTRPTSDENLASKVCNLLDTMSPILKRSSFFVIEYLNKWFKSLYIGAYPIDSPQNISYYWT